MARLAEATAAQGATDRRIRPEDMYLAQTVRDPAVSPDGARVCYVAEEALRSPDGRFTHLEIASADGASAPRLLTRGTANDHAPQWSPDGRRLAFLSTRPAEARVRQGAAVGAEDDTEAESAAKERLGEDRAQVWAFDMASGGEPRQVTSRPEGVEAFAWAPDGERIVIASRQPTGAEAAYLKELRTKKGPIVVQRTQHKYDGAGYLDTVQTHLFVVDLESRAERQVTDGPCSEGSPRFSPDGSWIVFVSNRTGDADGNRRRDLWLVSPDGGSCRRLTFGDVAARDPRFSPDGRFVAFVSAAEPESGYAIARLWRVATEDAVPVADLSACVGVGWSALDSRVPDEVRGDPVRHGRRYPLAERATPMTDLTGATDRPVLDGARWLDADTLVALAGDRGQTRVLVVTGAASVAPRAAFGMPGDRGVSVEGLDAAGGTCAAIMDRADAGREVHALLAADAARPDAASVRLSAAFAALASVRDLASVVRIAFRDADGQEVEGLVTLPPGFDPGRPRPAPTLLAIHGGPMSYDGPGFRIDTQCWAAQGYLVLKVNYRGSISYGEAFSKVIQGDWGPREHDDVMGGVDELARRGWADPERLYVTGFSQGGIMTNWAIGHTDRFRAAVSEHSMWDYVAAFGTDDCHLWWQDDMGVPWQNMEGYRRQSPSIGADRIATPTLITAGQEDWRCPLDQSELLYMALRKRGVPTELVIYPGEHHAVTRPKRALDRLRRIAAWLERYGGPPAVVTADGAPPAGA